MSKLYSAMAIGVFATTVIFCQSFSSLSGTVVDPSGAVIPSAAITVTNAKTGAKRETKSDGAGRYSFQELSPGNYKVAANAAGFGDVVHNSVDLLVSSPTTLVLKFEVVGSTATTVSVEADATSINTTDASIGNTIGTKPITQLPFEARSVVGLLALQPGVTYLGEPEPGATSDYRSGTVNGGKADQGNVTLDGVDVNDQQNRNSFTSVLRVTLDSVQEFRTITTNAGAEFGRTSGAQVTLVTKSGSNSLHGSFYEYLRNTATSANSFFNNAAGVPRQKLNRNVFGAAVGGPVKKNRLFFFMNYEGRRDASQNSVVRIVPGDLYRQGIFMYTRTNGTVGTLSPAQIKGIDPGGIGPSASVLQVLQQYPHTNDNTVGDGLNTFGYRFNAITPLSYNTYIAKIDYQIDKAGNQQIFWRGNLQNDNFANTAVTGLQEFPGQAGSQILDNSKGQAIGYTWVIKPTLVNNLRYGYTRQGTQTTGVQTTALSRYRPPDLNVERSYRHHSAEPDQRRRLLDQGSAHGDRRFRHALYSKQPVELQYFL